MVLKNMKALLTLITFTILLHHSGISQCTVDVTILEGDTLYMCADAPETITASAGYNNYVWTGPETLNGQSITPNFQGQYVVAATDEFACVSTDTIEIIYYPPPADAIISSEGSTICPGSPGTTLSLSGSYMLYDWNSGAGNSSTFLATAPGNYTVTVADANGCVGTFNYTLLQPTFTVESSTGTACIGSSVVLTASGGSNYQWSTGETGSVIVVSPATTTNYSVTITLGTCVQTLTIPVTMGEIPEYDMPDTIFMSVGDVEFVQGPTGFLEYTWYPDDFINDSTASGVFVTAGESHTLYMTASHAEGCTVTDSVVIIVVNLTIPTGFSPNGDSMNDKFVIPELADLDGKLTVWNRWGDIVFESEHYENDWNGNCENPLCYGDGILPDGTYFYLVSVEEISYKGYFTLKK